MNGNRPSLPNALKIGIGVIVVVVGVFGTLSLLGRQTEQSARKYLAELLPRVLDAWDVGELLKEAHPNLLVAASPDQLAAMFEACRIRLGSRLSSEQPVGAVRFMRSPPGRLVVVGDYTVDARFEKAQASIQLRVIRESGVWKVAGIYVVSPAFLNGS